MNLHGPAADQDDKDLTDDDNEPHRDEHGVGEDALEDVDLIVDLTRSQHVEDLEEHEQVEDNGKVAGGGHRGKGLVDWFTVKALHHSVEDGVVVFEPSPVTLDGVVSQFFGARDQVAFGVHVFFYEEMACEDDSEEHECLEETLSQDVLDHPLRNDVLLLSVGRSLEQVVLGLLSGEGQGAERVHDQVDPQQLDGLQRGLPHNN
mmetsp:Transcript_41237/g.62755  ORF Transcript_41237/g.62755 Transcript_41237/m.62755 type:complete len:204 (-) Transcript_41237:1946-2557(-)